MLQKSTILFTGGTGSLGINFIEYLYTQNFIGKIILFSRDEHKQARLQHRLEQSPFEVVFILGDVSHPDAVEKAFLYQPDIVIHAAALKHVAQGEDNPQEFIRTNITGTENLIRFTLRSSAKQFMLISSDKAASPGNLYGSTKLIAEKLTLDAQKYSSSTIFSAIRFGNFFGSRGSVVPILLGQKDECALRITSKESTRFSMSLHQSVSFLYRILKNDHKSGIYIPKCPSYRLGDLTEIIAEGKEVINTGLRKGEKLHESMLTPEESLFTLEEADYYLIQNADTPVRETSFSYHSNENKHRLSSTDLKKLLSAQEL